MEWVIWAIVLLFGLLCVSAAIEMIIRNKQKQSPDIFLPIVFAVMSLIIGYLLIKYMS